MLTQEQIFTNKQKYLELLSKLNIDLTKFFKYLDAVDYFNKPATAVVFRAYPGGLCQYALDLCFELGNLCSAYFPGKYTEEDIIKVALLRDIYRAELYEPYLTYDNKQAYKTKEERPTFGTIGFSSYMIAKYFFTFTDEQIEAICLGKAVEAPTNDIYDVLRSYPLVTLTKMADMAASFLEPTEKIELGNE